MHRPARGRFALLSQRRTRRASRAGKRGKREMAMLWRTRTRLATISLRTWVRACLFNQPVDFFLALRACIIRHPRYTACFHRFFLVSSRLSECFFPSPTLSYFLALALLFAYACVSHVQPSPLSNEEHIARWEAIEASYAAMLETVGIPRTWFEDSILDTIRLADPTHQNSLVCHSTKLFHPQPSHCPFLTF
jgi:hypothetical protein